MKLSTARNRSVLLMFIRVLYVQFGFILFLIVGKYDHINKRVKDNLRKPTHLLKNFDKISGFRRYVRISRTALVWDAT